ncbi:hypothetical protein [Hydrogeniiclostridium mannosilyticum]|uniref:hypothetical protein n=1 Tax=Hydrogeniiclostridium mannosilyticum TaxID=2764322 RepID=UPI001C0A6F5D|nr:hypothetical protein [Hydrogeniiclostridium mannosilyticum]
MGRKRVLGGSFITIITYQSTQVLDILHSGKVYRAYPSRTLNYAYSSLIDMLGLHCQSPIFGYLKYHRHLADGRLSSSVRLTLKVPREHVKLTEFQTWAEFIYYSKLTKPYDYTQLKPEALQGNTTEISQKKLDHLIRSLKRQKSPWAYRFPQAVLEEIRPEWVADYKILLSST